MAQSRNHNVGSCHMIAGYFFFATKRLSENKPCSKMQADDDPISFYEIIGLVIVLTEKISRHNFHIEEAGQHQLDDDYNLSSVTCEISEYE